MHALFQLSTGNNTGDFVKFIPRAGYASGLNSYIIRDYTERALTQTQERIVKANPNRAYASLKNSKVTIHLG